MSNRDTTPKFTPLEQKLGSMVTPVDTQRSLFKQILEQRGLSARQVESRMARFDERREDRERSAKFEREEHLAVKALCSLTGVSDVDADSFFKKVHSVDVKYLETAFAKLLLQPALLAKNIEGARAALEAYVTSVTSVLAEPLADGSIEREFSAEQITEALLAEGAKREARVLCGFGSEDDELDTSQIEVELQGEWCVNAILDTINECQSFDAQSRKSQYERVLASFERLAALNSIPLVDRVVEDFTAVLKQILESESEDESVAESDELKEVRLAYRLKQMAEHVGSRSPFWTARGNVRCIAAASECFSNVIDEYERLAAVKAIPFFLHYPSVPGSTLFETSVLSEKVSYLASQGVDLSKVLELYRSASDTEKLDLLGIIESNPDIVAAYGKIPTDLRRSEFISLVLNLARLDSAQRLAGEPPVMPRFLRASALLSDRHAVGMLVRAPVSLWRDPRMSVIEGSGLSDQLQAKATVVLASCLDGKNPHRGRLLGVLLEGASSEFGRALDVIATSSEKTLAQVSNPEALLRGATGAPDRQRVEKADTGAKQRKGIADEWIGALRVASEKGRLVGISQGTLDDALNNIGERCWGRVGYVMAGYPAALPPFLQLCAEFPELAKVLPQKAEIVEGFCRAVTTSSADAVTETVRELIGTESNNLYGALKRWLGSVGTRPADSRVLFSVSEHQILESPKSSRTFSKVFFLGGQHGPQSQLEIAAEVPEGIRVRFYHGLERTNLDLSVIDDTSLVICLTRSLSHPIHDRVKQRTARAGGQFCYLTKTGVQSTREFLKGVFA